jgi:hypothetical protein
MTIVLLRPSNRVTRDELERAVPAGTVVACDFYVEGIERDGVEVPGGYQAGRVLNIDHHAPAARMARPISSAPLAIERLAAFGRPGPPSTVVLNHTDCDSVLTGGIMAGQLPPDPAFGRAAVAADHTGEPDPIADLLQALQHHRDLDLSLRNLRALLDGRPLEPIAASALADRQVSREEAAGALDRGRVRWAGPVAWVELDRDADSLSFVGLIPTAAVVLLFVPQGNDPGRRAVKYRLGTGASPGLTLHDLRLAEFDPGYGGRWNAGSNKRSRGTDLEPATYAEEVARRVLAAGQLTHPPGNPSAIT